MNNRWVIPDVHGCIKTLRYLLEDRIDLQKDDTVFFLGDYIDRGPDSKGLIDYLMNLQNSGYNIRCIRGNHEDYCIRAWEDDQKKILFHSAIEKDWRRNGGTKTLESFGVKRPRDIDKTYIDWMKKADS